MLDVDLVFSIALLTVMIIDMTKNSTNECYGLYTLYFKVQVNDMEIGCCIN